jgi:hypothetical protein
MPHICMEEVLAFMAVLPGLSYATVRFKNWWHTRHLRQHPTSCPHDHKEC